MRTAAVALLSLLTVVGISSAAPPVTTPERVSVAVTTANVRQSPGTRVNTLLLWNRNIRTTPIGHGLESCIKAGYGGVLGGGLFSCNVTIVLPLGKVVATGIVHNFHRYSLIVTGGTGEYVNASGPLFMRSMTGDGVRRLTFSTSS